MSLMLYIRKLYARIAVFAYLVPLLSSASEISTNAALFTNSPSWLTTSRVNQVIDRVQSFMEWDIRKIKVIFHENAAEFQKLHGFGSSVAAYSVKTENSIHLGPIVRKDNFDEYFGHELVHIILFQKYKDAVPSWLNEGLANYVSKHGKVDYSWLNKRLSDFLSKNKNFSVTSLTHPYTNSPTPDFWLFHYQASTALIEMIAKKCNLNDLLQLSVGKKLETYLSTTCEILDINSDFQNWVKKRSQASM
jgi:hypothetical protein